MRRKNTDFVEIRSKQNLLIHISLLDEFMTKRLAEKDEVSYMPIGNQGEHIKAIMVGTRRVAPYLDYVLNVDALALFEALITPRFIKAC